MRRIRLVGVRFLLFGIAAIAAAGLITSGLWNALMPGIFGLPLITFWQGLGLLVLGRLLFGHFGGRGGRRWGKPRFVKGLEGLTPEERERFRAAMGKGPECRPHPAD